MRNKGFSLIEIALCLLIIGILGSQLFPTLKSSINLKRQSATEQKQKTVVLSLAGYVRRYYKLPFPATPASLGVSMDGLTVGIVPYQTLGIDESFAKDGCGQYMTYATNQVLARTDSVQPKFHQDGVIEADTCFCYAYDPNPALTLVGKTLPDRDYLAFVLISHQAGAVQKNGNRAAVPVDPSEAGVCRAQNRQETGQFCVTPCGDTIVWATRSNFLSTQAGVECKSLEQTTVYD